MHPALIHLPRGWLHHGDQILALIEQHEPQIIVELGTHLGASAIAIARVAQRWKGIVYCVDTWYGVPKPGRPVQPVKIAECARNFVTRDVSASIRMICATTLQAAECWTGPIDCLYVDAEHSHEGCLADLEAWGPHVRSGGLLLGDDYGSVLYPGVKTAWETYGASINMPIQLGEPHETNPPGMQLVYGVKP